MKQVIQSFKTGDLSVWDVPSPGLRSRGILVRTGVSLVSAGTERMIAEFAEKNLIQKAQSRPDLVRQVTDKIQREGILETIESVQNKLDQPLALGYSSAGTVVEVGAEASGYKVGDRVACAGGDYANHAEVVYIPRNLAVKLPDNVSLEAASFATVGAIAMQGIRQAEVTIGHHVAVIGLGLLGQLTIQMLKAAGCKVYGMDINPARAALALELGADAVASDADTMISLVQGQSLGRGADAVLITADTRSNDPVALAGEIARDRAIVVAVGAVGLDIPRKVYYEKELDFRLSRSYGPGRYDPEYEEKGNDYPAGYVRFTQQRNLESFIQLVAEGKIDVEKLTSHRFPIDDASKAYDVITGKTGEIFLGVLITYPEEPNFARKVENKDIQIVSRSTVPQSKVSVGILGAGNFVNATLLPAMKGIPGIELLGIASGSGLTAKNAASKFGFKYCSSNEQDIFSDPDINTIIVATRHDLHAHQVIAALNASKNVFCEKPLCLTDPELAEIVTAYTASAKLPQPPSLLVGYNRRFAPFIQDLKAALMPIQEPLMLNFRANAGFLPANHWTQDLTQGGGRLLGEACHFIDLLMFLAGSHPLRVTTKALPDSGRYSQDNLSIVLEFANGSIGNITYVANGDKGFAKEYLEVFGGGLAAKMDNYRVLQIRQNGKTNEKVARLKGDKGHKAEWEVWSKYLLGQGSNPISFEDLVASMAASLAAQKSLLSQMPIELIAGDR
jgi:predicted dehydrogenase